MEFISAKELKAATDPIAEAKRVAAAEKISREVEKITPLVFAKMDEAVNNGEYRTSVLLPDVSTSVVNALLEKLRYLGYSVGADRTYKETLHSYNVYVSWYSPADINDEETK